MTAEYSLQTFTPLEFKIAPDVLDHADFQRWQIEQEFIDKLYAEKPSEAIEDVSAVVHETNRIPDPRVLEVVGEKILRLDGVSVDSSIEKQSYLGRLEWQAFEDIKRWAGENNNGIEIWFSPPFQGVYPVSKIDLGEIRFTSDQKHKVILKKAILLDIDSIKLLEIANDFVQGIGFPKFESAEEMRSLPRYCTRQEINAFFERLSSLTNQIEMIRQGFDLEKKAETYQKLTVHEKFVIHSYPRKSDIYYSLRKLAEMENMIGDKSESCPTAFQSFSGRSRILSAVEGWHSGTCRICGSATWVGSCSICELCEAKF